MNVLTAVDGHARGSLLWRQLRLDPAAASLKPKTDSHVWLAPREVRSSLVVNDSTKEAEKYLFYRGVGNLDAPIVVRQEGESLHISLRDDERGLERLPRLWIVEVMPDERVRHQTVEPQGRSVTVTGFAKSSGSQKSSLEQLKRELAAALTGEGLYADEAAAMLATWRLSYFESEGLRVFFLLPQSLDRCAPAALDFHAGRHHSDHGGSCRAGDRASAGRAATALRVAGRGVRPALPLYAQDPQAHRLLQEGGRSHAELYRAVGREVPESLQLYESLGRFRDALLAHEWQARRPTPRAVRVSNASCGSTAPAIWICAHRRLPTRR